MSSLHATELGAHARLEPAEIECIFEPERSCRVRVRKMRTEVIPRPVEVEILKPLLRHVCRFDNLTVLRSTQYDNAYGPLVRFGREQ